jgi:DNA primase
MFPLHNHFGKVIGFTGRVMPGEENPELGKYVNSPETPIFQKSKLLYGFWKTKNAVRDASCAVLVEGQMDFLMAYQDGVKNLVATSGTALTDEHLKLLRRLSENIVMSFDNDNAGKAAAERTIDLAQLNDFNTKVIIFDDPTLKDPADIAKAKPGHFAELINQAVPAMEYYFFYYGISLAEGSKDIAQTKKAIRNCLIKIKQIQSPIEQAYWVRALTAKTGFPETAIQAEMATLKVTAPVGKRVEEPQGAVPFVEQPMNRLERVVRRILSIAVRDKEVMQQVLKIKHLFPDKYQPVLEYLAQSSTGMQINDSAFPPEIIGVINLIHLEAGFEPGVGEVEVLFAQLGKDFVLIRRRELQEAIRQAEIEKDNDKLTKLLKEYNSLSRS